MWHNDVQNKCKVAHIFCRPPCIAPANHTKRVFFHLRVALNFPRDVLNFPQVLSKKPLSSPFFFFGSSPAEWENPSWSKEPLLFLFKRCIFNATVFLLSIFHYVPNHLLFRYTLYLLVLEALLRFPQSDPQYLLWNVSPPTSALILTMYLFTLCVFSPTCIKDLESVWFESCNGLVPDGHPPLGFCRPPWKCVVMPMGDFVVLTLW